MQMHFTADVLDILGVMSLRSQNEGETLISLKDHVDDAISQLELLKTKPGTQMKQLLKDTKWARELTLRPVKTLDNYESMEHLRYRGIPKDTDNARDENGELVKNYLVLTWCRRRWDVTKASL